jgi:hypothetical protein
MKPCKDTKVRDQVTKRCRKVKKPTKKTRVPAAPLPRVPAAKSTKPKSITKTSTIKITQQQEQLLNKTITGNTPSAEFWKSKLAEELMKKANKTGPTFIQGVVIPITRILTLTVFFVGGVYITKEYLHHRDRYHRDEEYRISEDFIHYLHRIHTSRYWKPFLMKYFAKPIFFSIYPKIQPGECPEAYPKVGFAPHVHKALADLGCYAPKAEFSWYKPEAVARIVLKALGR